MGEVVLLPPARRELLVRAIVDGASRFRVCEEQLEADLRALPISELEELLAELNFVDLSVVDFDGVSTLHDFRRELHMSKLERFNASYTQKLQQVRDLDRFLGNPVRDVSGLRRLNDLDPIIEVLEEELMPVLAVAELRQLEHDLGLSHMDLAGKSHEDICERIDHLVECQHRGYFRPRSVSYARNGAPIMEAAGA